MILLSTGFGNGTITITLILLLMFLLLLFRKVYFFKGLAVFNKLIFPSLYKRNITHLKKHEQLLLAYRYWVTKNSL